MAISEIITTLADSGSTRLLSDLQVAFAETKFGLLMSGLPQAEPGQALTVDGSGSVTMQYVSDPDGRSMIKLCADPDTFDANYPGCINVTMSGREVIEMAEKLQDADGILICSATSFHSFPTYRDQYKHYLNTKKRWQFWR